MENYFEERVHSALEELKRADHLLFVSLKYTRTCDVILNVIARLISAYDLAIKDLLIYAKEEKKLKIIPTSTKEKLNATIKLLGPSSKKYIKHYELLKTIHTCNDISIREEFRKNITLTAKNKKITEVKAETLKEYYQTTREFVIMTLEFVKQWQDSYL